MQMNDKTRRVLGRMLATELDEQSILLIGGACPHGGSGATGSPYGTGFTGPNGQFYQIDGFPGTDPNAVIEGN